jgi:hypothetical protein
LAVAASSLLVLSPLVLLIVLNKSSQAKSDSRSPGLVASAWTEEELDRHDQRAHYLRRAFCEKPVKPHAAEPTLAEVLQQQQELQAGLMATKDSGMNKDKDQELISPPAIADSKSPPAKAEPSNPPLAEKTEKPRARQVSIPNQGKQPTSAEPTTPSRTERAGLSQRLPPDVDQEMYAKWKASGASKRMDFRTWERNWNRTAEVASNAKAGKQ